MIFHKHKESTKNILNVFRQCSDNIAGLSSGGCLGYEDAKAMRLPLEKAAALLNEFCHAVSPVEMQKKQALLHKREQATNLAAEASEIIKQQKIKYQNSDPVYGFIEGIEGLVKQEIPLLNQGNDDIKSYVQGVIHKDHRKFFAG